MAITKKEIVNLLCEQTELPKMIVSESLRASSTTIKSELEKGNPMMVSGFGKWTVKAKTERKGRNPQTGEELTIKARKVIAFPDGHSALMLCAARLASHSRKPNGDRNDI